MKRIITRLRREQRLLAMFIGGALMLFAFVQLAGEMGEGETLAFDRTILRAVYEPGCRPTSAMNERSIFSWSTGK